MVDAAYFHIPFCEHICHYCDFNKVFLKGQPVDEYLLAMEKEIQLTFAQSKPPSSFTSIFVGGGTPTSLTETQLAKLCEIIKTKLPFNDQTEFTFEANPGDLSPQKFQILKNAGVNRISFGVQTFNNDLLKKIGRTHRAEDVRKTIELARITGFENISIDLIYSLPGQTIADFTDTLKQAFALDLPHFSGYSLIIEPKTVFYNLLNKGKLPTVGEDTEAKMYEILMEEMEKHGYQQYEISNFAKPGYESRHNLTYWNNDYYYGFGAGAHSYVQGYRRSNFGPLKKYMDPLAQDVLPLMENHLVTKNESIEEEMFLGLRKTKGVSLSKFQSKYHENLTLLFKDELEKLQKQGLIEVDGDYVRLTKCGKLLGNEVFQSFLGVI
ncbi:oxygen-independent coproporphyrinogen III oxidase [Bacillus sp. DNRA2]|uniref:radical SAM family heme chaperone HemW n=1 Tax=Bacillus sp. DNRA2 TaxID=2723053 RepID=UPI00145ED495|nr:radical SAM family heme chaperone HemW [Bacillus sp. DNRA2]NMD70644.1 oxygen-independent coproporphyrinogen III oxidase [Bacillus sp. DNRA2]